MQISKLDFGANPVKLTVKGFPFVIEASIELLLPSISLCTLALVKPPLAIYKEGVLINVLYPRSPINIKYDISLSDFAPPFNVKSYELSGLLSSPRFL